jgi:predicted dehydrogenase
VNYDVWLGQTPWREFNPAHFGAWRYFWDTAEGVITDMGCHYTDLMQFTLGTDATGPVEFEGTAEFPDPKTTYSETPIRAEARCRYANGIKAVMHQRAGFTDRYIRFIGDAGWVQVDDQTNIVTAEPKSILQLRPIVNKGWDDTGDHIGDWLHGIKTRTQPVANPETAHRAMSICQLFNLSLRLGQKLQWDPAKEKFLNSPDASRMLSRARRAPWTA